MTKFSLSILIISLMINSCIGTRDTSIKWTRELNQRILDIYHGTLPLNKGHLDRMKAEWDKQLPQFHEEEAQRLRRRAQDLMKREWKIWQTRPLSEQEELEDILTAIYIATDDEEPHHEMRMLNKLLEIHPEYKEQFEMVRTVVHKWYKRYAPLGKELNFKDVDWTPQRKADLLHIADQVKLGKGPLKERIKSRWLEMHGHLNVKAPTLLRAAYNLKRDRHQPSLEEKNEARRKYEILCPHEEPMTEDGGVELRGKRIKWTRQLNTSLLYIHRMVLEGKGSLAARIKDRWSAMYKNLDYMSAENLLARVKTLKEDKFKPTVEELEKVKEKYEQLPPIPPGMDFKGRVKLKNQKLKIREGQKDNQQHQDDPASPDFELTPEELMWLRRELEVDDTSHTGHANYSHENYHYDSSSHTLINQGHFALPPDTSHPHQDFSHLVDNSSHTSSHQFSSLPDTQYQHHQLWNPGASSSHTLIDQASSSTQPHVPYPYQHQWNQYNTDRNTPSDQVPLDSQSHIQNQYHRYQ